MREIKSFILLAEQLHFGRAASLLNLSQPALTKQIRRMEEELGSALFERGRHGTVLSAFGRQFLDEARRVAGNFDDLLHRARNAALGEAGKLALGFGFHTLNLVPPLVVKLRALAPGIQASLRDMSSSEQVDGLRNGSLDLGFVRLPAPQEFMTLPVMKDRLALVSSPAFPLAPNTPVSACRDMPFVTIAEARAPGFFHHMVQYCGKHGFHPRIVQQVREFSTAMALVQAGMGLAIIPESGGASTFPGMQVHPLRDKDAAWPVGAAWRRGDTNPALAKFLTLLKAALKKA